MQPQRRKLFQSPTRAASKPVEAELPLTPDSARELLEGCDHEAFYRSVASLARPGHGSVIQTMEFDSELGFHRADCVTVEPKPQGLDALHLYAKAAWPSFDEDVLASFMRPENAVTLADTFYRLTEEGGNVALVTNHGEIIDIAVVLAGFVIGSIHRGAQFGVLGEDVTVDGYVPHMNLLVSRMVASTAAFGLPTMNVLQSLCRTYLSVPQTVSRRRAKIDSTLARASNVLARHELAQQLDRGGQLLAMAASGSQDLRLASGLIAKVRSNWRTMRNEEPREQPSLHLQPLYDGTINLMLATRYVLPIAVSLNRSHPACVLGQLTRVRSAQDCHDVMHWIAETHQHTTKVVTVYHQQEYALLDQVRTVMRSAGDRSKAEHG